MPESKKPPIDAAMDEPSFADEDGAERHRWILAKNARSRLDKYLQNRLKSISRNQIQKLIALGGVTVNAHLPKASTMLHKGDVVEVILPPRPVTELVPQPIPLDVVFEDEHLITVNKPSGLIVHPAKSHLSGTLLNALAYHFQNDKARKHESVREGEPISSFSRIGIDETRPGVVHRLDMNTTGVIVIAKNDDTHWLLARQFENRTCLKVYLAVVHGEPDHPTGAIDQPIGKHPTIREAMAVRHDSAGKQALTLYRVRERYQGYSLLEVEIKTGRTHQIRVHLSYLGYPLAGDLLYGGDPIGSPELSDPPQPAGARPHLNFARDRTAGRKLEQQVADRTDMIMPTPALHAGLLRLNHPVTKESLTFTAPVHEPMHRLIQELRARPAQGPVATNGLCINLERQEKGVERRS